MLRETPENICASSQFSLIKAFYETRYSEGQSFEYMNKMISPNDFPETADIETSSEDYARRFSGAIGAWFLSVQEKATLRMLTRYPNASILDVGGGHGQLTGVLLQHGYRVTVLGSADVCKARIQKYIDGVHCSFKVGNILNLPYGDQSFDVVISYRLLPHVKKWEEFISELTRVAKECIIVDYPSVQSINFMAPLLFKVKKHIEVNTRPYTSFRESELRGLFKMHRFVRADRYPEFFVPMVLHRLGKQPLASSVIEKICRLLGITYFFGSPVILRLVREGK